MQEMPFAEKLELINVLDGENVHVEATENRSFTGQLNVRPNASVTSLELVVGSREDVLRVEDVLRIRRV